MPPNFASDAVFALFWFQGYEFRPRFVDLSDKRFWRFDPAADSYWIKRDPPGPTADSLNNQF